MVLFVHDENTDGVHVMMQVMPGTVAADEDYASVVAVIALMRILGMFGLFVCLFVCLFIYLFIYLFF